MWRSLIFDALLPVSYLLLADSAGLLLCDDTFNLLVEDPLLLHLKTHNALGEQRQTGHSKPSENASLHIHTNVR